jgi:hypothetical protein
MDADHADDPFMEHAPVNTDALETLKVHLGRWIM